MTALVEPGRMEQSVVVRGRRVKLLIHCCCLALPLMLASCGLGNAAAPQMSTTNVDWRDIATDNDRMRLRQWRTAWTQALAKATAAGHGGELAKEGALLQPDAAMAWAPPPVGEYRCRTIKIGAKSDGLLDYVAYPAFDCRIRNEDGLLGFAKLTGSQRPLGVFLPDTRQRMVFLGTLQLGDESRALQYGRDRERDMAGIVERVDERRWRLVLPYPHFESTMDVLELVPRG